LKIKGLFSALVALVVLGFGMSANASAALSDRESDPVVLTGAVLPDLVGTAPGDIVAFKWDGGWTQVPVQVDERKLVNYRTLYPFPDQNFVTGSDPVNIEAYADPLTLVGADSDPNLDANDEVAAMAKDAGGEATDGAGEPAGVVAGSGVKVAVSDPVDSGSAFIYMFKSAGSLDPSAGKSYVDYDQELTDLGPGQTLLDDYKYADGPNPEDTKITTPFYESHHSDRWIEDGLTIKDGVSTPVDILDRDKALFYPGYCGRSENTFTGYTSDVAEGSFIVNKNGPVRALRSYVGANSGPYTQREHIYYERRQDIRTFLRVHPIPMVMAFYDYSPEASGMTYRNSLNPGGVTVDGVPDPGLTEGVPTDIGSGGAGWEQVTGDQGTVDIVTTMKTTLQNLTYSNYYLDDSTPSGGAETQCTGDAFAYGSSGFRITSAVPQTDPRSTSDTFESTRSLYYGKPNQTAAAAEKHADQVVKPLSGAASKYDPSVVVPVPPEGKAALKIKLRGKLKKAKPGKKATFLGVVTNTGDAAATGVKVCSKVPGRLARGGCAARGLIPAGATKPIKVTVKVKRGAKPRTYGISIGAKADGVKGAWTKAKVKVTKPKLKLKRR